MFPYLSLPCFRVEYAWMAPRRIRALLAFLVRDFRGEADAGDTDVFRGRPAAGVISLGMPRMRAGAAEEVEKSYLGHFIFSSIFQIDVLACER